MLPCLEHLWMTSPGKQGQTADVNGHASFSVLTGLLQDLGPWVWRTVWTARTWGNLTDSSGRLCVCENLLLSFFESQGFSLHWNKVPRRPYKSGSQLWRFTHFLVRLHPHRFSFCFPNMLEPVNLGLSQEFCSCLPLYGILCHCPSLDFSVTQFLDPRSLPERSLPWPLRFKQS